MIIIVILLMILLIVMGQSILSLEDKVEKIEEDMKNMNMRG